MSTGVGVSSCCISGKIHDGTPRGRVDTIGGLPCYIAEPKDGSKARSIVYITDIFGWELPNVRLHADNYAAAGFYCYVPDLHSGNSIPISFLQVVEPPLKDQEKLSLVDKAKNAALVPTRLGPWLISHREAISRPLIDGFVNAIRMVPGTNKIGAIGFCWGARYAILQAHGPRVDGNGGMVGGVDAAFAAHPSLVSIPADFDPVTKLLSLAVGTKDSLLSTDQVGQIQDLMAKKTDVPHELRIYDDQVHGFALRGDWSSEKDKKSMDEAEKQGIQWFDKFLA